MTDVPPGFRDSPQPAVARGEVIGNVYTARDEIARTDAGVVIEARDMMLDRLVAIMFAWRDPGTPSLILDARRTAAVRDPCAVSIHGMGNHFGMEYVVAERVTGTMLRDIVQSRLSCEAYLAKLRTLVASVARAHEQRVTIGELSGSTVLVQPDGRVVLGRLSMSQVPSLGPSGQLLAPEVLRGEADPHDPAAGAAIDLYGLGCVAIELARGNPPFSDDDRDLIRGHAHEPPPRLSDIRPDLPAELSDLVDWLLAKSPAARPRSAAEVLLQLDAIVERTGRKGRPIHVLVVDDDTARARWLWSLVRRAAASAVVEVASEGTDAAHKLNRDHPDLVFVDASLRGVMNALELCMYARGLEQDPRGPVAGHRADIVLIGNVPERERAMFDGVTFIPDDAHLAAGILEHVRRIAAEQPRTRRARITISG